MLSQLERVHRAVRIVPSNAPKPFALKMSRADIRAMPKSELDEILLDKGHVLIQSHDPSNPNFQTAQEFDDLFSKFVPETMPYQGGAGEREPIEDTSVHGISEDPPHMTLCQHNEMCYTPRWPSTLIFGCFSPPSRLGRTPLADTRKVTEMLPDSFRDRLEKVGVMYTHHFTDAETHPKDVPYIVHWQQSFGSRDRNYVEKLCLKRGYEVSWQSDGSLKTTYKSSNFIEHPKTKEIVFFSDLFVWQNEFWFDSWGEPWSSVPDKDKPYFAWWGDGSHITLDEAELFADIVNKNMAVGDWNAGSAMIVENHLYSHGRESYPNDGKRKLGAILGNPVTRVVPDEKIRPYDTCFYGLQD